MLFHENFRGSLEPRSEHMPLTAGQRETLTVLI